MLVATVDLRGVGYKLIRAGEPIPDPEKWNQAALHSNINIGRIKDVQIVEAKPQETEATDPTLGELAPETDRVTCPDCQKVLKNKKAYAGHVRTHRK